MQTLQRKPTLTGCNLTYKDELELDRLGEEKMVPILQISPNLTTTFTNG